jgi:hypothetical protein
MEKELGDAEVEMIPKLEIKLDKINKLLGY